MSIAPRSEAFGACKHGHQIKKQPDRGQRGEPKVDGHDPGPLCIVAQGSVAQRRRQQAQDEADPEDVLHVKSPAQRRDHEKRGAGSSAVHHLVQSSI
jgi:hypothetical protein